MANDLTKPNTALVIAGGRGANLMQMRANPDLFPRLKTFPREQAVFEMSKIVTQAFLYKGQAADQTSIQFISSSLVDELMADDKFHAGSISFGEIQSVVKKAVLGSDMFGISVSSLYRVIIDYVKGEGHLIQKRIDDMRKAEEARQIQNSPVSVMIQATAAEIARKNKVR